MEPTPEDVQRYIAAGLQCSVLEVDGDGRHFNAGTGCFPPPYCA